MVFCLCCVREVRSQSVAVLQPSRCLCAEGVLRWLRLLRRALVQTTLSWSQ